MGQLIGKGAVYTHTHTHTHPYKCDFFNSKYMTGFSTMTVIAWGTRVLGGDGDTIGFDFQGRPSSTEGEEICSR